MTAVVRRTRPAHHPVRSTGRCDPLHCTGSAARKGCGPPARDASGYRRYDAAAVVELIRIRTLAGAGVPLSRVRELLDAGPAEFAAAVNDIDRRLRAEIRVKQGPPEPGSPARRR